ncbi:nicotinate (nicotinamide) nucleotide adenylyltransferase [Maridesulfovibrio bastinii]|uniref:nicotinate (nicotinamide) nucleotide adenylyltransferase n=1 Tax=Maridesulfovibrio bastinii TaxID=47157 RepID=UPI0003F6FA5C|nr:nicotinate (nicotinamide) nucleotide adenylyltransferase [Maridesulfovibrio bastinii]
MKLGLFGGSFNPVHNTHIDVAKAVAEKLSLDKVLLVPAGAPYHKKTESMLSADIRYNLVRAAVEQDAVLGVSDLDLISDVPTYTVDTLKRAGVRYPDSELFFLMGQDSFETLHLWREWNLLGEMANLVVISRGDDPDAMKPIVDRLFPDAVSLGNGVFKFKSGYKLYIIDDLDFKISATQVRKEWLSGGDCSCLLPPAVLDMMNSIDGKISQSWESDC